MINESLEERLANRRKPGDPDYDPFYDATDDELAEMVPPFPSAPTGAATSNDMTTTEPHICTPNCEPGCAHAAAAETNAQLRSQLAEAREALVCVAKALGWDAPPEQVPNGVPDLTIAVQQLRRERDQAREAYRRLAEALGFPDGDLCEAIRALRRERDDALQEAEIVGRHLHFRVREVDRLNVKLAIVTQERDQATKALVQAETERDETRDRLRTLIDELAGALEMSGTPNEHEIIRTVARLRAERDRLRRRLGDVLDLEELLEDHTIMAAVRRLRAAVRRLRAERSATPDTGKTA